MQQKQGLDVQLKETWALVENNRTASAKQRLELKQARKDLLLFEDIQAKVLEMETAIQDKAEVAHVRTKLEAEIVRLRRALKSERDTATRCRVTMGHNSAEFEAFKMESESKLQEAVSAYEALKEEFFQRTGEMPLTSLGEESDE